VRKIPRLALRCESLQVGSEQSETARGLRREPGSAASSSRRSQRALSPVAQVNKEPRECPEAGYVTRESSYANERIPKGVQPPDSSGQEVANFVALEDASQMQTGMLRASRAAAISFSAGWTGKEPPGPAGAHPWPPAPDSRSNALFFVSS